MKPSALTVTALSTLAAVLGTGTAQAVNIANEGTAIIGTHTGIDSAAGVLYGQAGVAANINDGNLTTRVDTWNGNQAHAANPVSFVGVIFGAPRADFIDSISLNVAAFFDGGWFGPNNSGPGASGVLGASHLTAPTVQTTTDGGTTWSTVAATDNYIANLTGVVLPAAFGLPSTPAVVTFNLGAPVTGVNGVRIIGTEGGTASGGFIGVFELGVNANPIPEPSLLSFAGLAALAFRRRRNR